MLSEKLSRILKCVHYQSFYFIFYGGYLPFLLYFPIYLKHIGFNAAQVGTISGIRPIFQCIVTPLLVLIGDKLRSRKALFIISSLVAIAKLIGLFLLLKPSNQLCVVKTVQYVNDTQTVREHSYVIKHKLNKRGVVMQDQPRLGKRQENMREHDSIADIVETRPHYPSDVFANYKRELTTVNWNENDGNSSHIGKNLSATINSTMPTPTIESLGENFTTPNHTITTTKSTMVKQGNNSRSEYRILNDDGEVHRLFYALLIIVLISDIFDAAMFTLVDQSDVGQHTESYGIVRLWGSLGLGLMAPAIAIVLHSFPHDLCGRMVDTYHYIFIFAIVFFNLSLLLGSHLDLDADVKVVKARKIHGTRSNFHYGMFLIVFAYAGFCNGFLFTFVNWFIDSIGGGAGIMGLATGCKCMVDVVLFFVLGKIIDYFGSVPIASVGLVGHIVVFFAFSRITNPWFVILVEIFHGIFHVFLVSTCAYYLDQSIPAGSNLRLQALLHGIYWGVGSGSGALFSGLHVDYGGLHETFILFTWLTTAVAFIYLAVELLVFVVDLKIFGDKESSLPSIPSSSSGSDADVSNEASSDVGTDDE